MSSNVRALEPVRNVHGHTGRPDRAEVEAAVQPSFDGRATIRSVAA